MKYFSTSFYYVRYSVLGKIIKETYRQFKWRVWLASVFFIFLFFLHQLVSVFFRLLDEIFHRGYKQVKIKQPVFIIANPRSGTTYLHRLMALDNERFTYTKFAHTFCMSSSFVQVYNAIRWVDRKVLRNIISRLLDKLDTFFWGGWDDIHALGFNKAEEDELVFAQTLNSTGIFIPFPFFDTIDDCKFLDKLPQDARDGVMDFYEDSVKRFVFHTGKNKTYLAKNVMSTGRFKSLIQRFPDAKIIYIARHPYDSVASFASMFTAMYKVTAPEIADNAPQKKTWAQLGIDFFKYSKEMRATLPPEQFIELKYDDLLQGPKETVLKIYNHFSWLPSNELLERLKHEQARSNTYKSGHEYSLQQYGFTKQEVYNQLHDIMEEFGFEKEF